MQSLAGAAYACHSVPDTWTRRPHGPDAAAPAMTEALTLRRAEPVMAQPVMGASWFFAPWHEPRRIAGQIALCIISGHWPYSSCQNKWPGNAWQDPQPCCLPCLQGRTCRRCSSLFGGCVRRANVSQIMPVSAYRSGIGLSWACQSGHAGKVRACYGHGGQCMPVRDMPVMAIMATVLECLHCLCSGSIRKTSFQLGAHQVLPCIWVTGMAGNCNGLNVYRAAKSRLF